MKNKWLEVVKRLVGRIVWARAISNQKSNNCESAYPTTVLAKRSICCIRAQKLSTNLLFCIWCRIPAPPGSHDRRAIPRRAHASVRARFDRQAQCRCNTCSATKRRRDSRIAMPSHFASWHASLAKRTAMPVLGRFASRHLRQSSSRRNQAQAISTCGSSPGQPHS